MKRVFIFLALVCALSARSQYNNEFSSLGTLRFGAGYTHDFPGLNGYTLRGEYAHSLNDFLDGSFAIQRVNLAGNPRTNSVQEFTKSTTIDFNIYVLPLKTEVNSLRFGVGYGFSFYNIRRSYPLVHGEGVDKNTTWPVQDKKARACGLNISGEYEYFVPGSGISLGIRASLFKAYDQVSYIGPFVGFSL